MPYTLRCILDVEQDVVRDIILSENSSLQELHESIVKYFELPTGEMASFYKTNEVWEQGEEIPLIDMSDAGATNEMKDYTLEQVFKDTGDNMLYVYDFLKMWTFFVTLRKISNREDMVLPTLGLSTGSLPEQAPEKQFIGEKMLEDFDDEFGDDFDDSLDFDDNLDSYY